MSTSLRGIYAAVVTPYGMDGHPSPEQFTSCLHHLAKRGCHGALVAGTTGEGTSLSVEERINLFKMAVQADSGLRLLAGTGAASLEDAVAITRGAFDAGCDAALVIPPFFYKKADVEGLFIFFDELIHQAVPSDGKVLLYHNPVAAAVGVPIELIRRLRDAYPQQVTGIKDSSQDWEHTQTLLDTFSDFDVFVGDDRLLSRSLEAGGAGSITLIANAFPDLAREVYDLHKAGKPNAEAQARLDEAHAQLNGLPRIPAVKFLLRAGRIIQIDAVRPPLRPLSDEELHAMLERFMLTEEMLRAIQFAKIVDPDEDSQS